MQSTCTMAGFRGGMLNRWLRGWPNTWIHMHKCSWQGSHIPDCLLGIHFAMGSCWVHGRRHNYLALVSRWWGVNGGMLSRQWENGLGHHHVYILAMYGEGGSRAGGADVVTIPSSKTTSWWWWHVEQMVQGWYVTLIHMHGCNGWDGMDSNSYIHFQQPMVRVGGCRRNHSSKVPKRLAVDNIWAYILGMAFRHDSYAWVQRGGATWVQTS